MIKLNLFLDITGLQEKEFNDTRHLTEFIQTLKKYNSVWLATEDGEKEELLITENIDTLDLCINDGFFELDLTESPANFYLQQFNSFEAAYSVALDMKESNPKCYDNDHYKNN